MKNAIRISVVLCLLAGNGLAGDWPHWRGPRLSGACDETGLPETWSATKNVAWSAAMPGTSAATPIVVGGRVFVSSTVRGSKDLVALCYQAADGKLLWRKTLATGGGVSRNTHASCSPVADAKRVIFMYGTGVLVSLDHGGKELWRRDLAAGIGPLKVKFGYSSSPLLHDGRVFVQVVRASGTYRTAAGDRRRLHSYVLALSADTGKTLWQQVRVTRAVGESKESYSSPVLYEGPGGPGVLVSGADNVTCHDPATGKELWRYRYTLKRHLMWRLVSSPVCAGGIVVQSLPRGSGLVGIRPPAKAGSKAAAAWSKSGASPDVCTPLYYQGLLYVLDGNKRTLVCFEPSAVAPKVLWQKRLGGRAVFRASPTGADGKIYCINMSGEVVVLSAGRTTRELSRIKLSARDCQSTIAAAGGRLYVRTDRTLYCIAKKRAAE